MVNEGSQLKALNNKMDGLINEFNNLANSISNPNLSTPILTTTEKFENIENVTSFNNNNQYTDATMSSNIKYVPPLSKLSSLLSLNSKLPPLDSNSSPNSKPSKKSIRKLSATNSITEQTNLNVDSIISTVDEINSLPKQLIISVHESRNSVSSEANLKSPCNSVVSTSTIQIISPANSISKSKIEVTPAPTPLVTPKSTSDIPIKLDSVKISPRPRNMSENSGETNLFDYFLVIGSTGTKVPLPQEVDEDFLSRFSGNKKVIEVNSWIESPHVLFHYKSQQSNASFDIESVADMVFPYGIEVSKLSVTQSASNFQATLFSSSSFQRGAHIQTLLIRKPDTVHTEYLYGVSLQFIDVSVRVLFSL